MALAHLPGLTSAADRGLLGAASWLSYCKAKVTSQYYGPGAPAVQLRNTGWHAVAVGTKFVPTKSFERIWPPTSIFHGHMPSPLSDFEISSTVKLEFDCCHRGQGSTTTAGNPSAPPGLHFCKSIVGAKLPPTGPFGKPIKHTCHSVEWTKHSPKC